MAKRGLGKKPRASGRHKPGSRTRATGYQGKSNWETFRNGDLVILERIRDAQLEEQQSWDQAFITDKRSV